jgi:hypothetical protein
MRNQLLERRSLANFLLKMSQCKACLCTSCYRGFCAKIRSYRVSLLYAFLSVPGIVGAGIYSKLKRNSVSPFYTALLSISYINRVCFSQGCICIVDENELTSLQVSSCSSLHKPIGALNTSLIIWRMLGGKGKAYLFIVQTGRCIYRFWRYERCFLCPCCNHRHGNRVVT